MAHRELSVTSQKKKVKKNGPGGQVFTPEFHALVGRIAGVVDEMPMQAESFLREILWGLLKKEAGAESKRKSSAAASTGMVSQ